MCLDLKDKYELSYIINGKDYGKIPVDIKTDTTYKFAFGFYQTGRVSLLSFEILY